ncbi:hypothetical protein GCM10022419_114290 [Nonomuraea rosea]|uniref:Glycosyl hydrolase family 98 putative carbohydrate-binding module domain-containing protein n=2 Tax=Nonomuraea rosea TaxID=638574 RepID=A0ABP6ZK79_9ACTN
MTPEPPASGVEESSASARHADESEEKYLRELTPVAGNPMVEAADVNGRPYLNSVILNASSVGADAVEYNLSRDWQNLKVTVGMRDDAPANAKARFEIFGDGNQLYRKDLTFGESEEIDIGVKGVLRLKLQTALLSGDDACYVVWGDALLKRK